MAHNRAFLPDGDISLTDFVIFCQTHLSNVYKIPQKSPIWDNYTNEEIIIEYFTLKFLKDENFKNEFRSQKQGVDVSEAPIADDFMDFVNRQEIQTKKELDAMKEKMGENLNFSPNTEG